MTFIPFLTEIQPYTGNAGKNNHACHYACPDCNGPTRITKTKKLVTTGGRRIHLSCKDQTNCLWKGQLWEGPIPTHAWRKKFNFKTIIENN